MLTIARADNIHIHLGNKPSILAEAILAGLAKINTAPAPPCADIPGQVQTFATLNEAPPALGTLWPGQGGRYGGTMPEHGGKPGYHLIVSERFTENVKFGPYGHDAAGATDHRDGLANTKALVESSEAHPAAQWAAQVTDDGHNDFYLPAHAELCQLWINVPQMFSAEGWYWSSTQDSAVTAWVQGFEYGNSYINGKDYEFRAVAVRRLPL